MPLKTSRASKQGGVALELMLFKQETVLGATKFDKLLELENKRKDGARVDKLTEISDKKLVYLATRNIRMLLQFHREKTIAENVTFGAIEPAASDGGGVRYGFTCTLTKDGRTGIIPVPLTTGTGARNQLEEAVFMVSRGTLVHRYRALSKEMLASYAAEQKQLRERELDAILQESRMVCAEFEAVFGVGD